MKTKNRDSAPTLEELKNALGSDSVGEPFEIKQRACRDVQKFINKINRIYEETKKTNVQFD